MLMITPTARRVLEQLPALTGSLEGGLRIARPDRGPHDPGAGFRVSPVSRARRSDVVVEQEGARVFLGPLAAERLRGRVLDARDDSEGRVEFVVRPPG